jgi:hypothetical protein
MPSHQQLLHHHYSYITLPLLSWPMPIFADCGVFYVIVMMPGFDLELTIQIITLLA